MELNEIRSIKENLWSKETLGYCSNVHPCESFEDLLHVINYYLAGVRQARQLDIMITGLWINATIAKELTNHPDKLALLKKTLHDNRIDLITLNGFPYGGFHDDVVKENVYLPDWCDKRRLDYTVQLANILAEIFPYNHLDHVEATISTVPLGFKQTWSKGKFDESTDNICDLVRELHQIKIKHGLNIRLCIEMEPSCILEQCSEVVDYFQQYLYRQNNIPIEWIKQHCGICYDICHQAVMFEYSKETLQQLCENDIPIGKIQVSSALTAKSPNQKSVQSSLMAFAETRYLHQVRTLNENRLRLSHVDLPAALKDQEFLAQAEWRIHFHVPIHVSDLLYDNLGTTQQDILQVLEFLQSNEQIQPHLEIETYTWHVLPEAFRPVDDESLINNLCKELTWFEQAMQSKGLLKN